MTKETIYAEEFGVGLRVEVNGKAVRVAIVKLGNSPNESEEIAGATIADYRIKNQLLPLIQSMEAV